MSEMSIKDLREIRGQMADTSYMQLSELEGIIIRYRTRVSMDVAQRYTSALLDLSVIQEGKTINTDMIQSVGYSGAITEQDGARLFIKEMKDQLAKFSAELDKIEAKTPDASEI